MAPSGPSAAIERLGLRQQPLGDLGSTIRQVRVALQGTAETALALAHLARPTSEDVHRPGAKAGLLFLLFSFRSRRGRCCKGAGPGHLGVADTPGMHGNEIREGQQTSLQSQGHASQVDVFASHGVGGHIQRKAQLEPAPAFPKQGYATKSVLVCTTSDSNTRPAVPRRDRNRVSSARRLSCVLSAHRYDAQSVALHGLPSFSPVSFQ